MRRFRLAKLAVLPVLATACATVPIEDEDRIERCMSGDAYRADLGITFLADDPRYLYRPDGTHIDRPGAGFFSRSYSLGIGSFRSGLHGGLRGGFGGFRGGGFGGGGFGGGHAAGHVGGMHH